MILVWGASGYMGTAFCDELERRRLPFIRAKRGGISTIMDTVAFASLKLVINTAACVKTPSVDCNEDAKAETMLGNLALPTMIACACQERDLPLIHVSTACLYQGRNHGKGWSETDPPQLTMDTGAGVYVASKELAERVVSKYDNAYICRMRLPFDEYSHPRNLLTKLASFETVVDETQSLTHRGDFAKACLDLFEKRAPFGIYNVTSPGDVDYRWVCEQINHFRFNGKKQFRFVSPSEFDTYTARTIKSRCSLSCEKLLSTGVKMRSVQDAVLDSLSNWRESP